MLGQPVKIGVFNGNRTMNHWIFLGLSHCKTHLYKKVKYQKNKWDLQIISLNEIGLIERLLIHDQRIVIGLMMIMMNHSIISPSYSDQPFK
jgi:hypothetical protein